LNQNIKRRIEAEGAPLIDGETATFVWFGKKAPLLASDFTDWERGKPITLHEVEPGVWAYRKTLPLDAYIEYAYLEGNKRLPDPHNPRSTPNGIGDMNHYFYMPDSAPTDLAQRQTGVKRGKVTRHVVEASHLTATSKRTVILYQPPTTEPSPLMVVWDGTDFQRRANLPVIVDNLIAQKRIRPLALAMVQNGGPARMVEYGCTETTLAFLKWAVFPLVSQELNLIDWRDQPGSWGVMGASMGGLMALFTALRMPDQFGSVLSLSGAFASEAYSPLIFDLVSFARRKPARVWMNVGLYDFEILLSGNRQMRDLLRTQKYSLEYREYSAGHNYPAWRDELWRGLEDLFPYQAERG
jgi:enterochelin esterase family protein